MLQASGIALTSWLVPCPARLPTKHPTIQTAPNECIGSVSAGFRLGPRPKSLKREQRDQSLGGGVLLHLLLGPGHLVATHKHQARRDGGEGGTDSAKRPCVHSLEEIPEAIGPPAQPQICGEDNASAIPMWHRPQEALTFSQYLLVQQQLEPEPVQ